MKMQICDCLVELGSREVSSITNMKKNMTVAEATYLNALHGNAATGIPAVTRIVNVRWVQINPMHEKQRLKRLYVVGPQDADKPHLLDTLFPGMNPRFPETFEDAGLAVDPNDKPFPVFDQHAADRALATLDDELEFYNDKGERVNEDGSIYVAPDDAPTSIPGTDEAEVVVVGGGKGGKLSLKGAENKLAAAVGA